MANLNKIYADLDLRFTKQPGTGDLSMVYDDRAVINSVKNLLLTNFYERPWQPSIGSNIDAMLFENIDTLMETTIAQDIKNVINNYEPRVTIQKIDVKVNEEETGYNVTLTFFVGNNTGSTTVSLLLERDR